MKTRVGLEYFVNNCSLSSKTTLLSHQPPYIQTNVLIGVREGLDFLIKKILKSIEK